MIKDFFSEFVNGTGLEVILSLFIANTIAQWIKAIRVAITKRKFRPSILFATGGMPSSHSSTVVAMATTIGLLDGFLSTTYAMAFCVATVVMFDAAGLRQNAGRQAKVLNKIVTELLAPDSSVSKDRLKEFLGHTPTEVFAGAALGIAVAFGLRVGMMHWLG